MPKNSDSTLQVVVARAITRSDNAVSGPGTCLFPAIPVSTYGSYGFLFLDENVDSKDVTEANRSSYGGGWSRGSEEGVLISDTSAYREAIQQEFSPLALMGNYLLTAEQKKSKGEIFTHNERSINGEPFAVFCTDDRGGASLQSAQNLRLLHGNKLPIIKYNHRQGNFFILNEKDNSWQPYQFPDNVLSAHNQSHCEVAKKKYRSHCEELEKENSDNEVRGSRSYSDPLPHSSFGSYRDIPRSTSTSNFNQSLTRKQSYPTISETSPTLTNLDTEFSGVTTQEDSPQTMNKSPSLNSLPSAISSQVPQPSIKKSTSLSNLFSCFAGGRERGGKSQKTGNRIPPQKAQKEVVDEYNTNYE